MALDLTGQVVIITGSAGHLGRATAKAFAAAGASLVLVDIKEISEWGQDEDLGDPKPAMTLSGVDVSDSTSFSTIVGQIVENRGRIDVLVHSVGGFEKKTLAQPDFFFSWQKLYDINLQSTLVATSVIVPVMIKQGRGKVITIAARSAFWGKAQMGAYAASKAAVLRFTESLSAEVKDLGVNVNCVIPGTLDTSENRANTPGMDYSRWVSPAAVADVIVFLASDTARGIHGAAIPVYGLAESHS